MNITDIAKNHASPFYIYDASLIRSRAREIKDAFEGQNVTFHYAVKANDNPAIIKLIADAGIGGCLVSHGEMKRAIAGSMKPQTMLMNGVGKSDDDIRLALQSNIGQLNVESIPELTVIADIARSMDKTATICLRINPEIVANAHTHTITARRADKFGILTEMLPVARGIIESRPELDWRGLSCHIGSQIHGVEELTQSYETMTELFRHERQTHPKLDRLDLGGGFGVSYTGDSYAKPAQYAALIKSITHNLQKTGVRIQMEPGRLLAAESGKLVTKVLYIKESGGVRFAVVDAAMNDLIRPSLYDAYHPITLVRASDVEPAPFTIVGPICESADIFARDRLLPNDVQRGDLLEIGFAGAYGFTMSSQYNARPHLAEILIDGDKHKMIRRAFSAEDFDRVTL